MPTESAFIQCGSCRRQTPKNATKCQHCGARQRRLTVIHWIGIVLGTFIIISIISAPSNEKASDVAENSTSKESATEQNSKPEPKVYAEGESVRIGSFVYSVNDSMWRSAIGGQYNRQDANASFLVVEVSVTNSGNEGAMIPSLELTDNKKNDYESSSKSWVLDRSIGALDRLNPGVTKTGLVVFDVPMKEGYKLKAYAGTWSDEASLIKLSPN
jgi:RNA polymerase subunit RPABC4/transcription elongation factor Spt4